MVCSISPVHPCDSFYSPLFHFSPSVSPRPPHPASYLENLLAKARHISVQLPSKSLLVDTLDRAAQWKKQAQQLQVHNNYTETNFTFLDFTLCADEIHCMSEVNFWSPLYICASNLVSAHALERYETRSVLYLLLLLCVCVPN